jgi:hypothetical protein
VTLRNTGAKRGNQFCSFFKPKVATAPIDTDINNVINVDTVLDSTIPLVEKIKIKKRVIATINIILNCAINNLKDLGLPSDTLKLQ